MFWRNIFVNAHERIITARNQCFGNILLPGKHRMFLWPGVSFDTETHDIRRPIFRSAWTKHLLKERPELVEEHFTKVETNRQQVAMVYADGRLLRVVHPAHRLLLWRGYADIRFEIIEVIPDADTETDLFEKLLTH